MMANNFIPKEKLHIYQRWEMDSLETPNLTKKDHQAGTQHSTQINTQNGVAVRTEEEIAVIFRQAKEEGYAAGYQEGNAAGYAESRNIAEIEVRTEVAQFQALLSSLSRDLQNIDQQVADDLLALAIALTKKMVTQALKLKPELIIPIVQEAIRNLPNITMQHPRLYLHPNDAKIVHHYLDEQLKQDNWSIREDEQLSRGGCRIETNSSEMNACLEVRWQRILSAIGQQDTWLENKD